MDARLLNEKATEEKGESARQTAIGGAIVITDIVKTTLGPKGSDKILQSITNPTEVSVTNDGATILKSIAVDSNAAAKLLIDVAKTQDEEVGDGTTSVTVLAGELLREADKLISRKIHPTTIIQGYRVAFNCARDVLHQSAVPIAQENEYQTLLNIARTVLSSKILSQDKEHFANIAVQAVLKLQGATNLQMIQFIKKSGGSLHQSYLDEGYILPKAVGVGQPHRVEHAKIMIANTAMDTDKVKIYGATVKTDSTAQVAELEQAEKQKMRDKVENIVSTGCNVFINRLLIYNFPEQIFAQHGVMAIEHAEFEGIERLALVTGSEIVSNFQPGDHPRLGSCDLIEEVMIGEDKVLRFSGLPQSGASTIVLRGASKHVLDEAERSLHDALCVLSQAVNDKKIIPGGGCSECLMAKAVDELAHKTAGKKSLAIEAFARALRQIPTILADNAGYDSQELVSQLRAAHYNNNNTAGLDLENGVVANMVELGITDTLRVKEQILVSASEAAEMILRIDNIIQSAPREKNQEE
nr:T-complex protein 1 subunit beta [Paratrimastix eleionoma]